MWPWGSESLQRTWNTAFRDADANPNSDTEGLEWVRSLPEAPLLGRGRAGTDLSDPAPAAPPMGRSKDGVGNCHLSQLRTPGMVKEVGEGRWVYNLNTIFIIMTVTHDFPFYVYCLASAQSNKKVIDNISDSTLQPTLK